MSHPTIMNAEEAVLVVVDIQERLLPAIANGDEVVENTRRLILGCKELRVPIILSEQYPKGLGSTVAPILEAIEEARSAGVNVKTVTKTTFACTGCDSFLDILEDMGRDQVILCGIEAHVCVTQTALDLIEEGSMVFLAADAIGSRKAENCSLAIDRLRQAGTIALPTESALFEMLQDSRHTAFKAIAGLVK